MNAWSQNESTITGRVLTDTNESLPYANIVAIDRDSNELIAGVISDEEGNFLLELKSESWLIIEISAIGFQSHRTEAVQLAQKNSLDFGDIIMNSETTELNEVVVKGTKPNIVVRTDRTLVNVEGSVLASGSSTLDIVERSPGVYVGQDGVFQINGRKGVLVMINNKRTFMNSEELRNYLSSISADNIKSIEVINNPSSKYDAEGVAGIINVILKESTMDGVNGSLLYSAEYNSIMNHTIAGNLNYKSGKWKIGVLNNYNIGGYKIDLDLDRRFDVVDTLFIFKQNSVSDIENRTYFGNGTVDYDITDNHTIGSTIQYTRAKNMESTDAQTSLMSSQTTEVDEIKSITNGSGINDRLGLNVHYLGNLDTLGSNLSFDLDYVKSTSNFNSLLDNTFSAESGNLNFITTDNQVTNKIFTEKIDFTKIFKENGSLEIGFKGSQIDSDNNQITAFETISNDDSDRLQYNEEVYAGYLNYSALLFKKIDFIMGMRTEHTNTEVKSLNPDNNRESSFTDFFPSLTLSHSYDDNQNTISINYNRRISRPNYQWLNPSVAFVDPFTKERGNPELTPMYSNNYEISQIFNKKYQFALSYSSTNDAFSTVLLQDDDDKTTTIIIDNLDKVKEFGFRAIVPLRLTNWWSMDNTINFTHTSYESIIEETKLSSDLFSYSIQNQHVFNLSNGYKFELFGALYGPINVGQFVVQKQYWVDFGISKSLMNDRLSLSVNATDIFRTRILKTDVEFGNIDTGIEQYNSSQAIRLAIRYQFAKGKEFSLEQRSGSEEEQERIED